MKDVALRKIEPGDLATFDVAFQSKEGASAHQWFGFFSSAGSYRQLSERGLLGGDSNMLAVVCEGDLVGRVEWFRKSWGRPETSWCWEIAIGLLPDCRGRGIGTIAQRLLIDYLFTHTPVSRVQVTTASDNAPEIRCLEKLSLTREGTIRSSQWRDGQWNDQLIFSTLRHEWMGQH